MLDRVIPSLVLFLAGTGGAAPQSDAQLNADKRACESGRAAACFDVALAFDTGVGAPRDASQAARFYEKACNGGKFHPRAP